MRVLLVEDEWRLAVALRDGLEAEGFAVDVANDGVEGLWLARENPYDVLVLDVMLPGTSGYELCTSLRAERNRTPILMLTAKDGEWDEVDGLDCGADDYLTKPFSYAVLLARLRALLRPGAQPRPAVLMAGQLRLDPATRRMWRGEVELTARDHTAGVSDTAGRRGGGLPARRPAGRCAPRRDLQRARLVGRIGRRWASAGRRIHACGLT